jgi:hypothetical protein
MYLPHPEEQALEGCRPVCGLMIRDGAARLLTMRVYYCRAAGFLSTG